MAERLPSLFLSHGAPTLALDARDPTHRFFCELGSSLERPEAVLMISAHWEAAAPQVGAVSKPETIHDFYGFPDPLYRITYPAPGSPELAQRVVELLAPAGISVTADTQRGIDHGAWVPMMLMYPRADIPLIQLSVQVLLGSNHHYAMGKALQSLRDEGVLIVASGGLTHNLGEADLRQNVETLPDWAEEFRVWAVRAIEEGRHDDLLHYRERAPHAARNHPSEEHFMPLFVATGAGGAGRRIHAGVAYRSLAMDAFRFD